MRFVSFATTSQPTNIRSGVECGNEIVDLALLFNRNKLTMREFFEMGESGLNAVRQAISHPHDHFRIAKSAVVMKAPINNPEKVVCIGMNYVDHCTEQNFPIPKEPIVFSKFASTIINPGDPVLHSNLTQELDFEVELAIVIGKAGRNIPTEQALEHIVGFTVAHDVSARDWQMKKNGNQWLLGKTMDSFCPLGPAIVTRDELKHDNLGIRCLLNGQVVQTSNTNQLIFNSAYLVHWCSSFFTLKPGDLILTGTPPGVGVFRKPPMFLKEGDVVTCEIDGIGSITNPIKCDPLVARL
jgi:2-keto-4-pentenoate hydratase/2-oxohepta-3-ene-1,7-dioic acid hydratase in catechol pathway